MKIAVIGSGFTGLSASYYLSKKGFEVSVFEKEKSAGGLAGWFKSKNWDWYLEKHYHHLFTTDRAILDLAKEIGHPINFFKPRTSIYYDEKISTFDSPFSLISFSSISFIGKLRTGLIIAFLKVNPFWKPLEKVKAVDFLKNIGGEESWKVLWYPLFTSKFGKFTNKIPASWFWARIKKRSNKFGYPKGGFQSLCSSIEKAVQKSGAEFIFNSDILQVRKVKQKFIIKTKKREFKDFDYVIVTAPIPVFLRIFKKLPSDYVNKLKRIKHRSAINLVLSLKYKFLPNNTYWLNVNDIKFPFLGVVEHTNFINNGKYNKEHVIYLGNYLDWNHPFFEYEKEKIIEIFLPYLQTINPLFKKNWIKNSWKFPSKFAQPIMTTNYSQKLPGCKTPIKGVYLACMEQIYPWDRQTNYAVEMGKKISEEIFS